MFDEDSKLGLEDIEKLTYLTATTKLDGAPTDEFKAALASFMKELKTRSLLSGPEAWFSTIEYGCYSQLCKAEGVDPKSALDTCRMADAQELVQKHQKFVRAARWLAKQVCTVEMQEYFG